MLPRVLSLERQLRQVRSNCMKQKTMLSMLTGVLRTLDETELALARKTANKE